LSGDPSRPGLGHYELQGPQWDQPLPLWLGDRSFLVALTWYSEAADRHLNKFLRFDLDRLEAPREVELNVGQPHLRLVPSGKLLVRDVDEPGRRVWVLARDGLRPATAKEQREADRVDLDDGPKGPCRVLFRRFPGGLLSWFVCPDAWAIYFGERLVRRT